MKNNQFIPFLAIISMCAAVSGCFTTDRTQLKDAAKKVFYLIPDHCKVSKEARPYMTPDLYNKLEMAWDVPMWADGEIGNEEFLYYFVTGNDFEEIKLKSVEIISMAETEAKVRLWWKPFRESSELETITLYMIKEDDIWKLDNFGDDIKVECDEYITEEVMNYASGKTTRYMLSQQGGECYTDEYISEVEDAFDEYIEDHSIFHSQLNTAATLAFYLIPDHCKVSEKARPYMTADLYNMLEMAWDVPVWGDGEIGEEEFLYYFVSGNDFEEIIIKSVEILSQNEKEANVKIKYKTFHDSSENMTVTLSMIKEGDIWILNNFGNDFFSDIKEKCKEYITEEMLNYVSGETTRYMLSHQDGESYSDEFISGVEKAFDEFIEDNFTFYTRIFDGKDDEITF